MKKKSVRLQPVTQLAEKKEKAASEHMVNARHSHESQESKLNELIQYRLEYIEQFQAKGREGIQSSQMQQYQLFIGQLEVAITQQRNVVSQASSTLSESQTVWRNKHSHKKAINKVVNRFKKQETLAEEKSEQNLADEHNTQAFNRNKRLI